MHGKVRREAHECLKTNKPLLNYKEMKIKHMIYALLAVLVFFTSCQKQEAKEVSSATGRVALAERNEAGEIVNLLKVEDMQAKINASETKEVRYVIESYSITDATEDSPYILTVSYFDLSENRAYNAGFVGDYLEEIANTFFLKENVVEGNYDIALSNNQVARCTNGTFSQLENPGPEYCPPGWFIRCSPTNCKAGGCKPIWDGWQTDCSHCEPLNPALSSSCAESNGPFWTAVTAIGNFFKNLFS